MQPEIHELPPEPEELPVYPEPNNNENSKLSLKSQILRTLRLTQKWSAYAFSTFAVLHLSGVVVAPLFSIRAADSTFMFARTIYQNSLVEPTLVYGSAGIHLLTGVLLHCYKVFAHRRDYGNWRWGGNSSISSGWLLVPLTLLHYIAVRGGPLFELGDSSDISLDYIKWSLDDDFWVTSVSLVSLVGVFTYHITSGIGRYWSLRVKDWKKWLLVSASVAVAALSLKRINRIPSPTGWQAKQFALAHKMLSTVLMQSR